MTYLPNLEHKVKQFPTKINQNCFNDGDGENRLVRFVCFVWFIAFNWNWNSKPKWMSCKQKCGWIGKNGEKTMSFRLCTHRQIDTDRIISMHEVSNNNVELLSIELVHWYQSTSITRWKREKNSSSKVLFIHLFQFLSNKSSF